MYYVSSPTRVKGVRIPRSMPPVYIVTRDGKRVDAFLSEQNAKAEMRRLNARLLDELLAGGSGAL